MDYIVLDSQQAATLTAATNALEVRGPDGTVLGLIHPARHTPVKVDGGPIFSAADIEEIKGRRESDSPYYTTEQVLQHLRSLEGR